MQLPSAAPGTPLFASRVRKRAFNAFKSKSGTDSARKRGRTIFKRVAKNDRELIAFLEEGDFPSSQAVYEDLEEYVQDD